SLIEKLVGRDLAGDLGPFRVNLPGIDESICERLDRVESELGRTDFDLGALRGIGVGIAPLSIPGGELEKLGRETVCIDAPDELSEAAELLTAPYRCIIASLVPAVDAAPGLFCLSLNRSIDVLGIALLERDKGGEAEEQSENEPLGTHKVVC